MSEAELPSINCRSAWDAQLARRLVGPLKDGWVTPNHLTTVRVLLGLAGAAAMLPGTYLWANVGALLVVASNFVDHADGELARISGKTSRAGHIYDLASDALVTVLLFIAIGIGVSVTASGLLPPIIRGGSAGCAIALIFYLRMRLEEKVGKAATRQASLGGFETEDVLYLLPLITVLNGLAPLLMVASICAPLFAVWVAIDYWRTLRRQDSMIIRAASGAVR